MNLSWIELSPWHHWLVKPPFEVFMPSPCSGWASGIMPSHDFSEADVSHECKLITFPSLWTGQIFISEGVFRSLKLTARGWRVDKALGLWHLALGLINMQNNRISIGWTVTFGFCDNLDKVFDVYSLFSEYIKQTKGIICKKEYLNIKEFFPNNFYSYVHSKMPLGYLHNPALLCRVL